MPLDIDSSDKDRVQEAQTYHKRKEKNEGRELRHYASKVRVWCPLRTCKFNEKLKCGAKAIQLHLYSDGRMKCNTYEKKPGVPRSLDFFPDEMVEAWDESYAIHDKGPQIALNQSEGSSDTSAL